jgi:hypothetical protein
LAERATQDFVVKPREMSVSDAAQEAHATLAAGLDAYLNTARGLHAACLQRDAAAASESATKLTGATNELQTRVSALRTSVGSNERWPQSNLATEGDDPTELAVARCRSRRRRGALDGVLSPRR